MTERAAAVARRRSRRPRPTTPSAARTCARGSTCCRRCPATWKAALTRWRAVNRRFKTEISGALAPDRERGVSDLPDAGRRVAVRARRRRRRRLCAIGWPPTCDKALREAKVHTSWLSPDEDYEAAVERFVRAILDRRPAEPVPRSRSSRCRRRVAQLGIYNSLAQLLIKITAPGVPDFYQGTELWDLQPGRSRQPPAGRLRRAASRRSPAWRHADPARAAREPRRRPREDVRRRPRAGGARARCRDVFERGDYVPIDDRRRARRLRVRVRARHGGRHHLRAAADRDADPGWQALPLGAGVWGDTRIDAAGRRARCRDVFTGAVLTADGRRRRSHRSTPRRSSTASRSRCWFRPTDLPTALPALPA